MTGQDSGEQSVNQIVVMNVYICSFTIVND